MADQEKMSPEVRSPEYVSLEDRFAQNKPEAGVQFDKKLSQESVHEKNSAQKDGAYSAILAKVKTVSTRDDNTVMSDASTLNQQIDRESQITHLIELATSKGVVHAVSVAKKAEDYYNLDQLHDRLLSDELHDALLAQGLIE